MLRREIAWTFFGKKFRSCRSSGVAEYDGIFRSENDCSCKKSHARQVQDPVCIRDFGRIFCTSESVFLKGIFLNS